MKKIIIGLVMLIFITSCTNKTEEENLENTNTGVEQDIENINNDDIKIDIKTNSDETNNTSLEDPIKKDTLIDPVSDEAALESEVNDLLDEFIDSLDSYDK